MVVFPWAMCPGPAVYSPGTISRIYRDHTVKSANAIIFRNHGVVTSASIVEGRRNPDRDLVDGIKQSIFLLWQTIKAETSVTLLNPTIYCI